MIENYVVELLFDHDCVIIPGFGGFVANYQPAYYDTKKNIFYPPQRKISFNIRLKSNDGILYNHLANSENISYNEAKKKVDNFVENINNHLQKKSTVSFPNLGTFTYKHQLIFSTDNQINFLKDTYGLSPVLISPLQKEIIITPKTLPISTTLTKTNYRKWLIAASFFLSLFLIPHGFFNIRENASHSNLGFNFNTENISPSFNNLLSSYPFLSDLSKQIDKLSEKQSALNPFLKIKKSTNLITKSKINHRQTIHQVTTKSDNNTSLNKNKNDVKQLVTKSSTAKSKKIVKSIQKGNFYLIIGSFKNKANAERFFKKSLNDFPQAKLFLYKNFYRIASSSFITKTEALKEKRFLKKRGFASWIMKY